MIEEGMRSDGAGGYGRGIAYMFGSLVLWVCMNAIIKQAAETFPTMQILFFRNAVGIVTLVPFMIAAGGVSVLATRRPGWHLLRSAIGVTGMSCLIFGLGALPLSDAITITYAAPLFITALSVPLLGEKVGVQRWCAVAIGFVGVLVMMRPGGEINPGAVVLLLGTLCFAFVVIITRHISKTEHSVTIVFYFSLAAAIVGAAAMPWLWVTPQGTGWLMLVAIGLLGGVTQMLLAMAIKEAPVSVTMPLNYLALVIAAGLDIAIWGIYPSLTTVAGAALIVATGLFIVYRESNPATRARLRAWFTRRPDAP
jgi:drug/metabolite transporter (DMT)-like permease